MSLKIFSIAGTTLIAIENPRIVAAMKAFGYIWEELRETPERDDIVVANLNALYLSLIGLLTPNSSSSVDQLGYPPRKARSRIGKRGAAFGIVGSRELPAAPA